MAIGLDWLEQASKGKFSTEQVVTPAAAGEVGSGFYGRMQKTANRLLIGKGQAVTLNHVIPGEYVPGKGITNTLSLQYGTGAILDYGTAQAGIYSIPGSLIQVGDKQLLLSPLTTAGGTLTAPVNGDTVTDAAGKVWTITQVKTVSPAGTAVLYDCNLRV